MLLGNKTPYENVYATLGLGPSFEQKIYLTYDIVRNDLVSLDVVNYDLMSLIWLLMRKIDHKS